MRGTAAVRRVLVAAGTALAASMVIFAILPLAGDPVGFYLHARLVYDPTPEQLATTRHQLGLDVDLVTQYLRWLGHAVQGDLGISYRSDQPVSGELFGRLAETLLLAGAAIALATATSLVLALLAARWRGRWPDAAVRVFCSIGVAVPGFVIGLALLSLVVVRLGLGRVVSSGAPANVWLPAVAVAIFPAARWCAILRAGLVDALDAHYVMVARARGSTRWRALIRHGLPNAVVPYLHAIGITLGLLLGGVAVVEGVFSWPGVGNWLVEAVRARDLPAIQAFALVVTLGFVTISLLVDMLTHRIDPRTARPR